MFNQEEQRGIDIPPWIFPYLKEGLLRTMKGSDFI